MSNFFFGIRGYNLLKVETKRSKNLFHVLSN